MLVSPSCVKARMSLLLMTAAVCLFSVATVMMLGRREPFYSWYYCFAWWSYIFFIESFVYRRGGFSLLFQDKGRYLVQLALSVTIWLVFEAFNFRLKNWHYIDLVIEPRLRWFGYTISFATVLPGIFATQGLMKHLGLAQGVRCAPLESAERFYRPFVAGGILCVALPLLLPKFFFPLVWLAFIFLLEPLNHRLKGVSLLRDLEEGTPRQLYLLLASGLCCGFLWEFWNFWAGSKWFYTIPFFGFLKIFEMPLLGFLGFPPFAVECYVMTNSFFLVNACITEHLGAEKGRIVRGAVVIFMLLFNILVFLGIDRFTNVIGNR